MKPLRSRLAQAVTDAVDFAIAIGAGVRRDLRPLNFWRSTRWTARDAGGSTEALPRGWNMAYAAFCR